MEIRPIDANALQELCNRGIQNMWNTGVAPVSWAAAYADFKNDIDSIPTLTPQNEWLTLEFDVVDTTTGKYPDWERIAREEAWAKGLVYCDMDGIAIREDGSLILLDECGNCVSCPPDRFEIRRPPEGEEDNND